MLANITTVLRPDIMRVKELAMVTWLELLPSEKSEGKGDFPSTLNVCYLFTPKSVICAQFGQ